MPNEQGGYTAEEEAEAVARAMFMGLQSQTTPPDQTPTIEQQLAQGPNAVAAGIRSQAGILGAIGQQVGRGGGLQEGGVLDAIQRGPLSDAPMADLYNPVSPDQEGAFYNNPAAFQRPDTGGGYPAIFGQGTPPAGFFTLNDYYQGRTPDRFQTGSWMNSTNDWRLLPAPYNTPDFFMINGEIIDRRKVGSSTQKSQFGEPPGTGYNSGVNVGYPTAFTNPGWQGTTGFGFPGSISGWHFGPSTGIT